MVEKDDRDSASVAVVFSCDDRYVPGVLAAVRSLRDHSSCRNIDIFVLHERLSRDSREVLIEEGLARATARALPRASCCLVLAHADHGEGAAADQRESENCRCGDLGASAGHEAGTAIVRVSFRGLLRRIGLARVRCAGRNLVR